MNQLSLSIYLFASFLIFSNVISAQDLNDNGNQHTINIDNCCVGENYEESQGNAQDYTIPSEVSQNAISFNLRGGDGGFAKAGADCRRWGGDGATVHATFLIGNEANQLKPGGKIRFVVGKHGEDTDRGGTASGGGGGGGGTAVLYQPTPSDSWVVLAVAGGGGGAHQGNIFGGCIDSQNGQGGRASQNGGNGEGVESGSGGTDGNGGDTGPAGQFNDSGGGGGAYTSGGQGEIPIGTSNPFGYVSGDAGYSGGGFGGDSDPNNSDGFLGRGGFGFGGGGSGGGAAPGGGGGGYSGGGGGGKADNGGGGGSYVNGAYAYIQSKTDGGNNSNSDHGYVKYQFRTHCTAKIAGIEETQGFCGGTNGFATIQVNLTDNPGNCNNYIYQIQTPTGAVFNNNTGTFNLTSQGLYTIWLYITVNEGTFFVDVTNYYVLPIDLIPPVAKCKNTSVGLQNNPHLVTNMENKVNNGSYDNCGIADLSVSKTSFSCSDIGTVDVTLTVTDLNGITANCISTVTVYDNAGPTPDVANLPTISADCYVNVSSVPTATDNCSGAATGVTTDPTEYSTPGTYTIIWTYTDSYGNTRTQPQTVIVTDTEAPVANCPEDLVIDANEGDCDATVDYYAYSTDNCDSYVNAVTYTGNSTTVPAGKDRILLAQISHFGTAASSATFNGQPMTLAAHQPNYVNGAIEVWYILLGTGGQVSGTVQFSGAGGQQDYASFKNVNQTNPIGEIDKVTLRNWIRVHTRPNEMIYEGFFRKERYDVNGTSGQTQIFQSSLNFGEARSWGGMKAASGGSEKMTLNAWSGAHVGFVLQANHATTISYSTAPESTFPVGTTPVTFTTTDKSNLSNSCTFNVTVQSTAPPTLSCPANMTINNDPDDCGATIEYSIESSDYCTTPTVEQTAGMSSGTSFPVGTTTNTFVATNGAGSTASCSFNVTVNDNTVPSASCQNLTITLEEDGEASLTAEDVDNGSSDNCNFSLNIDQSSFDCSQVGTHTVTLTVTDENSNASSCTSTVTVEDNSPPIASCSPLESGASNAIINTAINIGEAGSISWTQEDIDAITSTSSDNCGIVSRTISPNTFDCSDIGTAKVFTITLTDAAGNASNCTVTYTNIVDQTPPVANCKDATIALDLEGLTILHPDDIDDNSSDICGIASYSVSEQAFFCDEQGTYEITLTVSDASGNTSDCRANVTVVDNDPATMLCQNKTLVLDDNGLASLTADEVDNGSYDNCDFELSIDQTSFTCADVGTNVVTLTLINGNNDSATCTANVTVEDNTAPIASCNPLEDSAPAVVIDQPVNIGQSGTVSWTQAAIDDISSASSDNCDIVSRTISPGTLDCSDIGTTKVFTITLTDAAGNSSNCTITYTNIADQTAPTASCKDATIQLDANGSATLTVLEVDDNSSDACGVDEMAVSQTAFDCSHIGNNTVILMVTDNYGNTSECTSIVTVEDHVAPIAICQDQTVTLTPTGTASLTASEVNNGSDDACGIASLSLDQTIFDCGDVGGAVTTLTVTDNNGNTSTCTGQITVIDNTSPAAHCQNISIPLNANGMATLSAAQVDDSSTDACGISEYSVSQTDFDCDDMGQNNVTLTVTDGSGNTASCSAVVTIVDQTPPDAQCQNLSVSLDANGMASYTVDQINNSSTDNCGVLSTSLDFYDVDCVNVGANTVTLTVVDNNDLISTCTATVTVTDDTPPTPVCQHTSVVFNGEDLLTVAVDAIYNSDASFDNCNMVNLVSPTLPVPITCDQVGSTASVTVTVSDSEGNQASCQANITVSGLPCGWTDDGGIGCQGSSSTYDANNDSYNLTAPNCTPASPYMTDQTAFTYTELCGDGEITVFISGMTGTGFAGIMMRENAEPGAPKVAISTNGINKIQKEVRVLPNYPAWPQAVLAYDQLWLRIKRTGNAFRAYASVDGTNWMPYMFYNIPMSNCVLVGLFTYSEKPNSPVSATFEDVTITGAGTALAAMPSGLIMGQSAETPPAIHVFPNPAQDVFYIDLSSYPDQPVLIQLFNNVGQAVENQRINNRTDRHQVDVSRLTPGIYNLVVTVGNSRQVERVVVAKE